MARPRPQAVDHALELFAPLAEHSGPLRAKAMFGGWGFYCGPNFFALVADDVLYLKADHESESAFRTAGSEPFSYVARGGRRATLSYWTAPEEALESPGSMESWARLALTAALRAQASRTTPGRKGAQRPE